MIVAFFVKIKPANGEDAPRIQTNKQEYRVHGISVNGEWWNLQCSINLVYSKRERKSWLSKKNGEKRR